MTIIENYWPSSQTACRDVLARCLEALSRTLPVERVILFGSHARGQAGPDSDVDLCVVTRGMTSQHGAAIERRKSIGRLGGKPPLSIIPISRERLAEKQRNGDPFFDDLLSEGIGVARREDAA